MKQSLQFGDENQEVCWGKTDSKQSQKLWGGEDDDIVLAVPALCHQQVRRGPGQEDLGPGSEGGELGRGLCQDLGQAAAAAADQVRGGVSQLSLLEILTA